MPLFKLSNVTQMRPQKAPKMFLYFFCGRNVNKCSIFFFFAVASLLSSLHQLKEENVDLKESVDRFTQRRDHLLAVRARLIGMFSHKISIVTIFVQNWKFLKKNFQRPLILVHIWNQIDNLNPNYFKA